MILNGTEEDAIFCFHDPPADNEWVAYTHYIGNLLDSRLHYRKFQQAKDEQDATGGNVRVEAGSPQSRTDRHARPSDPDLIILSEPTPTWGRRLLRQTPAYGVVSRTQGSVLFGRSARRPLRHILLVVRDHESDEASLSWAERLAVPSRARVTVLPVVPAYPRLYRRGTTFQPPLNILIDPATSGDSLLAQYPERLKALGIRGTMNLRQGPPVEQIHREVRAGAHDMIVIAAESHSRWERLLLGELVGPLLSWADRPVLVAR